MNYWTKAHKVKVQDKNELEQIYELKYIFYFFNT